MGRFGTDQILRGRHVLEAVATLTLALIAIVLEILHVETVFGVDVFRVALPALSALIAVTLLELLALVSRLQSLAGTLASVHAELDARGAGSRELDRLSETRVTRVQRRGRSNDG
ncbi:hypothetical protein GCM10027080_18720 [Pedococcus soli]